MEKFEAKGLEERDKNYPEVRGWDGAAPGLGWGREGKRRWRGLGGGVPFCPLRVPLAGHSSGLRHQRGAPLLPLPPFWDGDGRWGDAPGEGTVPGS